MKRLCKLLAVVTVLASGLLFLTGTAHAAKTVESGEIGNNLTWVFTDDGTLTVSGEGEMDFGWRGVPWKGNYRITNGLEHVVIEAGVTSVGTDAFAGYSKLKSITLADTVTTIKSGAFSRCTGLTEVRFSENLTRIEQYAFAGCSGLLNITIPVSVTYIGSSAFSECTSLADISIPGSVEIIYEYTFRKCTGLTELTFCEGVSIIGDDSFAGCTGLIKVSIPESITLIEAEAFAGCTGLTSIVIPNGNTSLQERAFSGCTGLTEITAPGWCASSVFRDCDNVVSFTVTEGYSTNGSSYYDLQFSGFEKLEHITLPSSVTGLHSYEFSNMKSLRSVTLSEGLEVIRENAFRDCTGLTSITIPGTVTEMEWDVFKGCTGLKEVIISEGVSDLGTSTFWGCTGLTNVTVPGTIKTLGGDVFRGCSGLTEVTVCDGVTGIAGGAFAYCSNLKSISLPDSLTSLGASVFSYCSALESITIPAAVRSLGECVFSNCTKLDRVYFEGDAPSFVSDAFYETTAKCYYPGGNPTWTSDIMQDYRGKLTWIAYCNEHVMGEWYTAKEASCIEEGMQQRDCENCDHFEEKTITVKAHSWDNGAVTKEPTEEAAGVKTFACTVCGETKTEAVAKLDHTHKYTDKVTAPTCTEDGYTIHTCACGDSYIDSKVAATGHKWDDGKVAKEPTTTAEGEKTFTCTVCSETRTEKIDVLPEDKPDDPKPVDNPFADVAEKDYYFAPVMWAVEKGVTSGLSADSFGPAAGCTRAQVVTFLWRAAGEPAPKSSENPFKDIKEGVYYYDAVLWAVENGITTGLSADTFGPNANCNRGQIVTFLWRAKGKPVPANSANPFTDVPETQYYYDAVLWAVEKGITTGMSATSFAPNATCTRGQIVTFLYRAYK